MNVFELIKEKLEEAREVITIPHHMAVEKKYMIDADEAISIVDEVAKEYPKTPTPDHPIPIDIQQYIEELEAKVNNNGWIPCSERLPDDFMGFEYLTVRRNQIKVSISYFCCVNHKWYTSRNSKQEVDVIMWHNIPLPAPYKEGGTE